MKRSIPCEKSTSLLAPALIKKPDKSNRHPFIITKNLKPYGMYFEIPYKKE
jgi:hypothetical protein